MSEPHDYASIKGHMARGAAWMVAMRWTVRGIGLINTIVIARLLTPADFGIVTMAWIVVEFLMVLTETNVDLALLRGNTFSRDYLDTAWTIKVISGTATMLVLLAIAPLAAHYYGDERIVWVIDIVALRALIMGFENIGVVEFRHKLQFAKEFRYWTLRRAIMLGFGLGLALVMRDYMALALAAPISGVITVGVSYTMSAYRPRFSLAHGRELWVFSQWLILNSVARFVNGRIDQFVIGGSGDAARMGSYNLAHDIAGLPAREMVWPIGRALTPTLAKITHDEAALRTTLRNLVAFVAMASLPAGLGLSAVADDATLVLLGDKWHDTIPFFEVLALCGIFEGLILAIEPYFLARKYERSFALVNLAQVALLVPAVVLAAEHWGIDALAWVRTAVTALVATGLFAAMIRLGWLRAGDLWAALWRPSLASLAMMAAVKALHDPTISWRLLSLTHDALVGFLVYTALLILLWLAAGRPEGPERTILAMLRQRFRRAPAAVKHPAE